MNLKKFSLAVLIAGMVLLIEFKFLPLLIGKSAFFSKGTILPVEEIERAKFNLIYTLKEAEIKILLGPYYEEEIGGIEVLVEMRGKPLRIVFSSTREPRAQLASLQLILKEAKMEESLKEGKIPKLIDLTVDKPYVSF